MRPALLLMFPIALSAFPSVAQDAAQRLKDSVGFYASFDEEPKGDLGTGDLTLWTRYDHETKPGEYVRVHDYEKKIFRIAAGKGVQGGALECLDVMPRRGRIYFPMQGKFAFRKDGWSGACSFWIKTNPNTMLKTPFCDPVQITNKGAHDGGLWIDFPDVKPRDLRMGIFNGLKAGEKPLKESDPAATIVRVKAIGFQEDQWHHVLMTWANFDTGEANGRAALYIDGKLQGEIKDRNLHMDWNVDQAGIYTAVSLIGMLDELALFSRELTGDEAKYLFEHPKLLAGLNNKQAGLDLPGEELTAKLWNMLGPDPDPLDLRDLATCWDCRSAAERAIAQSCRQSRQSRPEKIWGMFRDATAAARIQRDYARWAQLPLAWTNAVGMEFRLIPPGTFRIGSPPDEPGRSKEYDETPQLITLTRPFYLATHETTVAQFRRFVEAEKYVTDGEKNGGGNAHDALAVWKHREGTHWKQPGYAGPYEQRDDHPVVHVSHADAVAFCAWLTRIARLPESSLSYDLPTEAQWEWACRAGSNTRYWWGNELPAEGFWINAGDASLKKMHAQWPRETMALNDGHAFPAPVGSYRANAFGLCDTLGNVWELCSTRYGAYPSEPATDPGDLSTDGGYAVRGGGWSNTPADVRCATRNADAPHFCHSNLGFRVALPLPELK